MLDNNTNIPKRIHYCWFGGKPKTEGVLKCIESWREKCPDYDIIEWNEQNFDIDKIAYTREAHQAGKWAFVSDVARLFALVNQGGIYLDTDVELVDSFDLVLNNNAFVGFEGTKHIATAVMACKAGNKMMAELLDSYKTSRFIAGGQKFDMTTNVVRFTNLLVEKGLLLNGKRQVINGVSIYPTDYFSPYDYINGRLMRTVNTIAIHWYSVSWLENVPLRRRLSQYYHRLIGKKRE